MRVPTILGFFLVLAALCAAASVCIECEQFIGRPAAQFTSPQVDTVNAEIEVFLLYENLSQTPSRIPITNAMVLIELSNSTGIMGNKNVLYKIYTDDTGKATFDFSEWKGGTVDFRILYCPFCVPGSSPDDCGFMECMKYGNMKTEESSYGNFNNEIENADDIPDAPGVTPPATINEEKYLPTLEPASYTPPPKPEGATPALCLPLGIIFSLLAGSLYMTGRNPFVGFNMGGARMGRHIRYQARGRGYSQSAMAVVSAVQSIGSAIKTSKEGYTDEKGEKHEGTDAVVASEKDAAGHRIFAASTIMRSGRGIKLLGKAGRVSSKMNERARAAGKEEPTVGTSFGRATEALRGRGRTAGGAGAVVAGQQMGEAGVGKSIRAEDLVESKGKMAFTAATVGNILKFAFTQSILGRTMEGLGYIFTGESMTENWLANHSERLQHDLQVEQALVAPGGGIEVDGTNVLSQQAVGDTTKLGIGVEDPTVEATVGEGKEEKTVAAQVVDGKVEVEISPDGNVTTHQFTLKREGGEKVTVQVQQVRNDKGQLENKVFTFPPEGQAGPPAPADAETAALALNVHDSFVSANPQLSLGSNAVPFVEAMTETVSDASIIKQNVLASLGPAIEAQEERVKEAASSKEAQEDNVIGRARTDVALDALKKTLPAADFEKLQRSYLGGGGPATIDDAVVGVNTAAEAAGVDKDDQSGKSTTLTGHLTEELGDNLSFETVEKKDQFRGVAAEIFGNSSAREVSQKGAKEFNADAQAILESTFKSQGSSPEAAKAAAEATVKSWGVTDSSLGDVKSAVAKFEGSLNEQHYRKDFVNELWDRDLSQVDSVADAGHKLDNQNIAPLLTDNPETMRTLPENVKQEIREYEALKSMYTDVSRGLQAQSRGDFVASNDYFASAQETNHTYLDASMLHVADEAGATEASEYHAAAFAIDKTLEAKRASGDAARIAEHTRNLTLEEQAARENILRAQKQGDYDTALQLTEQREQYHKDEGNELDRYSYEQLRHSLQEQQSLPPEQRSQGIAQTQAIFSDAGDPARAAHNNAIEIAIGESIAQSRNAINSNVRNGDYETALAEAIRLQHRHELRGADQAAKSLDPVIQDLQSKKAIHSNMENAQNKNIPTKTRGAYYETALTEAKQLQDRYKSRGADQAAKSLDPVIKDLEKKRPIKDQARLRDEVKFQELAINVGRKQRERMDELRDKAHKSFEIAQQRMEARMKKAQAASARAKATEEQEQLRKQVEERLAKGDSAEKANKKKKDSGKPEEGAA